MSRKSNRQDASAAKSAQPSQKPHPGSQSATPKIHQPGKSSLGRRPNPKPAAVESIWNGWIDRKQMTLFASPIDVGCSYMVLDILAKLSRVEALPGGQTHPRPLSSVIITRSHNIETVEQRLAVLKPDNDYITIIDPPMCDEFQLYKLDQLVSIFNECRSDIIFIEECLRFFRGQNCNLYHVVQPVLEELGGWLTNTDVSLVMSTHLNKAGSEVDLVNRVSSSFAFVAEAPHLGVVLKGDDKQVLSCLRNRGGPKPKRQGYIVNAAGIGWTGEIEDDQAGFKIASLPPLADYLVPVQEFMKFVFKKQKRLTSDDLFLEARKHKIDTKLIHKFKDTPQGKAMMRTEPIGPSPNQGLFWIENPALDLG
jgi:hypothetical protein